MNGIGSGVRVSASFQIFSLKMLLHTATGDRSFDVAGPRLWNSCLLHCGHLTVDTNSEDS